MCAAALLFLSGCTPPHERPSSLADATSVTAASSGTASTGSAANAGPAAAGEQDFIAPYQWPTAPSPNSSGQQLTKTLITRGPLVVEAPASQRKILAELGTDVKFVETNGAAQLSYYRINDGMRLGTASESVARPALSLIKLYLAAYVLEKGTVEEKYEALEMLTDSSDKSANELYERYPESVNAIAAEYNLTSTRGAKRWGYSVTSTYDVVNFVAALIAKDPTHPVLVAMSQPETVSEDGYKQDFGTARLSNVIGTKWGWSDDKSLHSSVSFGKNFVVAAAVTGSADDLTKFVRNQVTPQALKDATTRLLQEKEKAALAGRDAAAPTTTNRRP